MGAIKETVIDQQIEYGYNLGSDVKYSSDTANDNVLTLFYGPVQCGFTGFPSPATEYIEKSLNLHSFVVKKPAATFFMRATGDSMIDLGIYSNDILVVDRSLTPKNGSIIVANLNGEFTLKQLSYVNGRPTLLPANKKYKPIIINEVDEFEIFGVLTFNLHQHV